MTAILLNRRMALVFGLALPLLQTGRLILWGRWPQTFSEWAFAIDAHLVGILLLSGVALEARNKPSGRLVLSTGWGFACGILYRSFFEQFGDPDRHGGHDLLVLALKGALLGFAVAGLVGGLRVSPVSRA